MTFTFHGTRDALTDRILSAAAAVGRDISIDDKYPDRMEIGFERHGHRGGRFFYADITEKDGVLTLTGAAEDSRRYPMSRAGRLWDSFCIWAGGFGILAFCALILWVLAEDLGISPLPFWIALLLCAVLLLIRIPLSRREQRKADEDFYDFLARALQA